MHHGHSISCRNTSSCRPTKFNYVFSAFRVIDTLLENPAKGISLHLRRRPLLENGQKHSELPITHHEAYLPKNLIKKTFLRRKLSLQFELFIRPLNHVTPLFNNEDVFKMSLDILP